MHIHRPRPVLSLLGATLLAGLASCSSPGIDWEFGPASLAGFGHTYSWMSFTLAGGLPGSRDPALQKVLREEIDAGLQARGYRPAEHPDGFLVTYRVITLDTRESPQDPRVYQAGSLVIYLLDPASQQLKWCGSIESLLDPRTPPQVRRERLQAALHELFASLPEPGQS